MNDHRVCPRPSPAGGVHRLSRLLRPAPFRVALIMAAALATASCAGSSPAPRPFDGGTASQSAPNVSAAAPAGFTNPVYSSDFADPDVISVSGTHYAFATNGDLGNVQTLTSSDLLTWKPAGDALPNLPAWTSPGKVWAPEVAAQGEHRFVLYYTSAESSSGRQAIGVATADSPEGPYVPVGSRPLVSQAADGGSIDASPFLAADGKRYLYWKNDGNAINQDTWIYGQRLSADGLKLLAKPVRLFKQTKEWEGNLVEAPFMYDHAGSLHLFYSANAYDSDRYAVGEARCTTPLGPCAKSGENPVLSSSDDAAGPGHCMVLDSGGRTWMVYHAWPPDAVGSASPGRQLWISEVTWDGDHPRVSAKRENALRP